MQPTQTLYLIRGAANTGKSTLGNILSIYCLSADDYPGIRINSVYHSELQKKAHKWCLDQAIAAMENRDFRIVVANTFTRVGYMDPYVKAARDRNYNVQIIRAEDLQFWGEDPPAKVNTVPPEIVKHQQETMEDVHPKKGGLPGIGWLRAARQFKRVMPDLVICDLIGTLIFSEGDSPFVHHPDQARLSVQLVSALKSKGIKDIAIASNQCGVGGGHMTPQQLLTLAQRVRQWLNDYGISCNDMIFATHRNSKEVLWFDGLSNNLKEVQLQHRADKPGPGMIVELVKGNPVEGNYFYIGDAHEMGNNYDYEATQNAAKILTKHLGGSLYYIPCEAAVFSL